MDIMRGRGRRIIKVVSGERYIRCAVLPLIGSGAMFSSAGRALIDTTIKTASTLAFCDAAATFHQCNRRYKRDSGGAEGH